MWVESFCSSVLASFGLLYCFLRTHWWNLRSVSSGMLVVSMRSGGVFVGGGFLLVERRLLLVFTCRRSGSVRVVSR